MANETQIRCRKITELDFESVTDLLAVGFPDRPRRYWIEYNSLLVAFGQTLCQPVSPWCSRCPVARYCPRIGVTHSR